MFWIIGIWRWKSSGRSQGPQSLGKNVHPRLGVGDRFSEEEGRRGEKTFLLERRVASLLLQPPLVQLPRALPSRQLLRSYSLRQRKIWDSNLRLALNLILLFFSSSFSPSSSSSSIKFFFFFFPPSPAPVDPPWSSLVRFFTLLHSPGNGTYYNYI